MLKCPIPAMLNYGFGEGTLYLQQILNRQSDRLNILHGTLDHHVLNVGPKGRHFQNGGSKMATAAILDSCNGHSDKTANPIKSKFCRHLQTTKAFEV